MLIKDLMYGVSHFCLDEAGDDTGGSGGGAAEGGDTGGDTSSENTDKGAEDTGADDSNNEDSESDNTDTKDTGEGDDKDKTADDDKTKEDSDDDAEKSKDDDDKGDDDDGTEPLTADDFEMPEGVEVDEGMMNDFLEIANNKELSGKERDQALVGLYAKKQQDALDAQYQSWDDTRNAWKTEAKSDKEIGGAAFEENLAHAQKALAHFGSKELMEFGEQYGWADHPEYLRMMVRVGKTLSEDNSSGNQGAGDTQTPIENRWYGAGDKK
ncbi:MAG: hypothetical protein JKX96_02880 [Acinetobacter sp.]|nr:hypothetical protein [Acinetobacter sp.]